MDESPREAAPTNEPCAFTWVNAPPVAATSAKKSQRLPVTTGGDDDLLGVKQESISNIAERSDLRILALRLPQARNGVTQPCSSHPRQRGCDTPSGQTRASLSI